MSILDPATFSPSVRGLGSIFAVVAGTTVAITTANSALGVAANSLAGLFISVLAGDIAKMWDERASDPRYRHPNHDLTRLLGDSIAHVLHGCADSPQNTAYADWFRALANIAAECYEKVAHQPSLVEIRSDNLPELFRLAAENGNFPELLNETAWTPFVLFLADKSGQTAPPFFVSDASRALQKHLFAAVREMTKRNFGKDGRAYAAISLDLNATILAQVNRIRESQQATQEQLQAIVDRIDALQSAVRAQLTPEVADDLDWLIQAFNQYRAIWVETLITVRATAIDVREIKQQNEELKAMLAATLASIQQVLAHKSIGEDPTRVQYPREVIAQAKLLVERGEQIQRAHAEVILRRHDVADRIIQDAKRSLLAEPFNVLTLEGDNWYYAGEFERAIVPYEQAVTLCPQNATARTNLAVIYLRSLDGKQSHRLQRAIEHLEVAANESPPESIDYGRAQVNLSVALAMFRPTTDDDSLLRAISAARAAIQCFSLNNRTFDRAAVSGNLALYLMSCRFGDKMANRRSAKEAFKDALSEIKAESHPSMWAHLQLHLGKLLASDSSSAESLRNAVEAFDAALSIYTRDVDRATWVDAQIRMADAYSQLSMLGLEDGMRAIERYDLALSVVTRDSDSATWIAIQSKLGIAWRTVRTGDLLQNLFNSIVAFENAVSVTTPKSSPSEWAMAQHNLAMVLAEASTQDMNRKDRCKLLRRAVGCCKGLLGQYEIMDRAPQILDSSQQLLEELRSLYERCHCERIKAFDSILPVT